MFGYVKPFKPQLRMCEYDTYKAVYCGLCRQLGKTFGPLARMTLNYDFTFLAVVSAGISSESAGFKKAVCPANPLKRKNCLISCNGLTYSACAAMIILYFKICDDIADSGFFGKLGSYCLKPFAALARRRAKKLYPETDCAIESAMRRQTSLENARDDSIDRASDPTACALSAVFCGLTDDGSQKKVLERFGYLLGRWIYLIDAFDDLEEDISRRRYNPFALRFGITSPTPEKLESAKQAAVEALNLTVSELAGAYELIEFKRYKSILDNVIYLGLTHTQQTILNKTKENRKNERPL